MEHNMNTKSLIFKVWIVFGHVSLLISRLLSQGHMTFSLEKSFNKFYGRYQDLTEKYERPVNVMVNDSFPG